MQSPGEKLFLDHCGNIYCHGQGGLGGGAPPVAGRPYSRDYVMRVIVAGVPNSAMRSFQTDFNRDEGYKIIDYVLSLKDVKPPAMKYDPIVTAGFEAGFEVFQKNCVVCHAFRGTGGKVGPDLDAAAIADAGSLKSRILAPPDKSETPYALINVKTKTSRNYTGVRIEEDKTSLKMFETTIMPPVARTLDKSDIMFVDDLGRSAMPADFAKRLTPQQISDLVTFLKQRK